MKGASVKVAILSFFSKHGLYFHHAKNQPSLRPPSTFSERWPKFWQHLLSEKVMKKIWCKIWVVFIPRNTKFLVWWDYWMRNKCRLSSTFCTFQTPLTLLTNSAIHCRQCKWNLFMQGYKLFTPSLSHSINFRYKRPQKCKNAPISYFWNLDLPLVLVNGQSNCEFSLSSFLFKCLLSLYDSNK